MKLKNIKKAAPTVTQIAEAFDTLVEDINALLEAVTPLNPDMDLDTQLAELTKRMEAARKGLGLTNRLPDGVARTMHRSRIMGNLNSIRAALTRVIKAQEQFSNASQDYEGGAGYGENEEDWQDDVEDGPDGMGSGQSVGVCPRCKGKAHFVAGGKSLADSHTRWECENCGHASEKMRGY